MLFFPQLTTGAVAQYPLRKRATTRSVINRTMDGREVRLYDFDAGTLDWELTFTGLSRGEASAIEELFQAAEGRLHGFTWLDPSTNLLSWSENLSAPAWVAGGFLQLTSGQGDPFGGREATRVVNTGQTGQQVEQSLAVPGSYLYCLSAWVRSGAATPVTLFIGTQSQTASKTQTVGADWVRLGMSTQLETPDEQVKYAIALPAGAAIDLFGIQAEPQPEPGGYVKTTNRSGVYSSARFVQDFLLIEAAGLDGFATSVKITAPLEG